MLHIREDRNGTVAFTPCPRGWWPRRRLLHGRARKWVFYLLSASYGSSSLSLSPNRCLEFGCHPLHAGVWPAAFPRSQRQRDADHDSGLSLRHSTARLFAVCRVRVSLLPTHGLNPHSPGQSYTACSFCTVWQPSNTFPL